MVKLAIKKRVTVLRIGEAHVDVQTPDHLYEMRPGGTFMVMLDKPTGTSWASLVHSIDEGRFWGDEVASIRSPDRVKGGMCIITEWESGRIETDIRIVDQNGVVEL